MRFGKDIKYDYMGRKLLAMKVVSSWHPDDVRSAAIELLMGQYDRDATLFFDNLDEMFPEEQA